MQTYSTVAGWFFAFPVGICMFVYFAWKFTGFKGSSTKVSKHSKWEAAACLVAALYVLGSWLKLTVVGPAFLRWHLGDVGFPAVLGMFLLPYRARYVSFKELPDTDFNVARQYQQWYRLQRRCIVIAVGLSYLYELFIGRVFDLFSNASGNGFVGDFDWIDMAAYTLGGMLTYACVTRALKHLEPFVEREIQLEKDFVASQQRQRSRQKSQTVANRRKAERSRRKRR